MVGKIFSKIILLFIHSAVKWRYIVGNVSNGISCVIQYIFKNHGESWKEKRMCFYSMNDLLDMCRDRRTGALLNGFKPALIMWMFHRIG